MNGHWVERWDDGGGGEGPYVDGERNGQWVIRWPNGDSFEGELRDGKPNGFGTITLTFTFENSHSVEKHTFEGDWRDGCLQGGHEIAFFTTMEACDFE